MKTRVEKESIWAISLLGIILFILAALSIFNSLFIFNSFFGTNKNTTFQATNKASVYESLNQRVNASVKENISDYKVKSCKTINHSDGEELKVCLAEFAGNTTGFYDSAQELLVLSSFDTSLLIHELFHASSLHFLKKGFTNFAGHEEQEKMAYNIEFLYDQIIIYKGDLIIAEISKKLSKK